MIYGFEDNKFYIDMPTISRTVNNMRDENDQRALEIAQSVDKITLGMSTGIDSQAMLHSFVTQDIPVECVFLYTPGYNDIEYNRIPQIEERWGIKVQILDLDIMKYEDEIVEYCNNEHMSPINSVHRLFLKQLPESCNLVQMIHDPFVYVSTKKELYYYQWYNSPEISRPRANEGLNRSGKYIAYGDTIEFLYSILNDDIFKGAFYSNQYFDGNGLERPGVDIHLKTSDRWDYYIKPIIYGKYWRDELIYFPKFGGWEHFPFMRDGYTKLNQDYKLAWPREHGIMMKYWKLLEHMGNVNGPPKRYFENLNLN